MSLTLNEIVDLRPDRVREIVRDIGLAHENNREMPYNAWEIMTIVQFHGTMIGSVMSRAFMAQPALREKRKLRGSRR